MIKTIPLMPLPYIQVKGILRMFYPIAYYILRLLPKLETDLNDINSDINAKNYISGAIFSFIIYFIIIMTLLGLWGYRNNFLDTKGWIIIISISLVFSSSIFIYILLVPMWLNSKRMRELDKDLLFAVRHLMIQTNAGVSLFEAIVSISEDYGDPNLDYGIISKEFKKIVKDVKSGTELTSALEESAKRNASPYYRRVIWQLANANKAGAKIGSVLKDIVEFLSDEQRISIRSYGSQLNPLALFYMLSCIIAPTMGLILVMIASTFIELPINEWTFFGISIGLVIVQIVFVGLIKSRRPTVAL